MSQKNDLKNQQFNMLTVLEDDGKRSSSGSILWKCQCQCGNISYAKASDLKNNKIKSCGCQRGKKPIDLKNKRFTRLIALFPTSEKCGTSIVWECICDCGTYCKVSSTHLLQGHTQSCGCLISKGEEKIAQLLSLNNISFIKQKTFKDLYFQNTKQYARYDFYVNNQYLIEFDGQQHFEIGTGFYDNENRFQKIQESDELKNKYAKDNNIPLIRIPYTHYDDLCIEDLLLETSKFLI